jgi:hypothetical protein
MYLTQNQLIIIDRNLARRRGWNVDAKERPVTKNDSTIINVGQGAVLFQREDIFTLHAEQSKHTATPKRVGLLFFGKNDTPIFVPDNWDEWEDIISGFKAHDHSRYYS